MLGRFHEISIQTADIRASVEFYERLGFSHAATNDTWLHPYGVLTDGRIFIGLHQRNAPSPTLTFVRAGIDGHAGEFEARGIELELRRTGSEVFNEIAFRDPDGQRIAILEARTYSPVTRNVAETSLCGDFSHFSIATTDFGVAKEFWEHLGFVALDESDSPYPHLPLTSDHLDLAFHRPRMFGEHLLVFTDPQMRRRIARLRDMELELETTLPRGLDRGSAAMLVAPEGTTLLLLETEP